MGNQDCYAMILRENEDPYLAFPEDRGTSVVECYYEEIPDGKAQLYEGCKWNEEVQFEAASGETCFQVSVWDQDPGGMDDFIGFTKSISIDNVTEEWGDVIELPLHTRKELRS